MFDKTLIFVLAISSIPVIILFVQALIAVAIPITIVHKRYKKPCTVTVLVPAHNEELVIAETINSIRSQLNENDRLIVVADNCTDNTAAIAHDLGAEILVRSNDEQRGKGFALDYGIRHIESTGNTPDVILVIDADCLVETGAMRLLVDTCMQLNRPIQALYLMQSINAPGLKQKVAEFAWVVKNWVRPLGFLRLGLPCHLMGTGMAFPWQVIRDGGLGNESIVEDMRLGIELTYKGFAPVFLPDAKVSSFFPNADKAENTQRTRWEHGHLAMLLRDGPRLLINGFKQLDSAMIFLALDLMVPPLALLTLILLVLMAIAFGHALLTGVFTSMVLSILIFMFFAFSVLLAWYGYGRKILTFRELLSIPMYIIKKIPIYCKFISNPQKSWLKTSRDK
ncbi:MAG: glycosyltransferase family 2 protein [Gammaproteobacteria bacterium]|nr:glycosyltransferase family 2 protein [Gammaproteobacteria bacterium]